MLMLMLTLSPFKNSNPRSFLPVWIAFQKIFEDSVRVDNAMMNLFRYEVARSESPSY